MLSVVILYLHLLYFHYTNVKVVWSDFEIMINSYPLLIERAHNSWNICKQILSEQAMLLLALKVPKPDFVVTTKVSKTSRWDLCQHSFNTIKMYICYVSSNHTWHIGLALKMGAYPLWTLLRIQSIAEIEGDQLTKFGLTNQFKQQ